MNPWTIIGWTIIALVVGALAVVLLGLLVQAVGRWALYRLSLKVPPAVGQRWRDQSPPFGGEPYTITIERIDADGSTYLSTTHAKYYGPKVSEWSERMVRGRGYRLVVED